MLENRMPRHVPAVAKQASGFVQRHPAEVARLLTWNAIWLILVIAAAPFANEIDLRKDWRRPQQHQQPGGNDSRASHFQIHLTCVLDEVLCRCSFKSGKQDTS